MKASIKVAVFIAVLSFIAFALLGVIALAGTGVDWVLSIVGGVAMGAAAYFIIERGSTRKRILSSVLFGLVLTAILVFGFQTQVLASLLTGLIAGVLTFFTYPIVVGKRRLVVKFVTVAVAAAILVGAFYVLDPVVYTTVGTVTNLNNQSHPSCSTPNTLAVNIPTNSSLIFQVYAQLQWGVPLGSSVEVNEYPKTPSGSVITVNGQQVAGRFYASGALTTPSTWSGFVKTSPAIPLTAPAYTDVKYDVSFMITYRENIVPPAFQYYAAASCVTHLTIHVQPATVIPPPGSGGGCTPQPTIVIADRIDPFVAC